MTKGWKSFLMMSISDYNIKQQKEGNLHLLYGIFTEWGKGNFFYCHKITFLSMPSLVHSCLGSLSNHLFKHLHDEDIKNGETQFPITRLQDGEIDVLMGFNKNETKRYEDSNMWGTVGFGKEEEERKCTCPPCDNEDWHTPGDLME